MFFGHFRKAPTSPFWRLFKRRFGKYGNFFKICSIWWGNTHSWYFYSQIYHIHLKVMTSRSKLPLRSIFTPIQYQNMTRGWVNYTKQQLDSSFNLIRNTESALFFHWLQPVIEKHDKLLVYREFQTTKCIVQALNMFQMPITIHSWSQGPPPPSQ